MNVAGPPIADRVERERVELGLSVMELARRAGIKNDQSLHAWLKGDWKPRDQSVWDRLLGALAERRKELAILERKAAAPPLGIPMLPVGRIGSSMPFAGQVPCGSDWGDPLASTDFIEVDSKYSHPERFCCRVAGDSCRPALAQGDLTIWHSDKAPRYGLIVLAQQKGDHGPTVKQLVYDEKAKRPRLAPIDPDYDAPEDGDGWDVIARLVAVVRQVDGLEKSWYLSDGITPSHLA